jgi:hypothetical protein
MSDPLGKLGKASAYYIISVCTFMLMIYLVGRWRESAGGTPQVGGSGAWYGLLVLTLMFSVAAASFMMTNHIANWVRWITLFLVCLGILFSQIFALLALESRWLIGGIYFLPQVLLFATYTWGPTISGRD